MGTGGAGHNGGQGVMGAGYNGCDGAQDATLGCNARQASMAAVGASRGLIPRRARVGAALPESCRSRGSHRSLCTRYRWYRRTCRSSEPHMVHRPSTGHGDGEHRP